MSSPAPGQLDCQHMLKSFFVEDNELIIIRIRVHRSGGLLFRLSGDARRANAAKRPERSFQETATANHENPGQVLSDINIKLRITRSGPHGRWVASFFGTLNIKLIRVVVFCLVICALTELDSIQVYNQYTTGHYTITDLTLIEHLYQQA